ncbi:protein kinase [Strigomonas culicis]|uniref:non-specific serine/threonine protein kinase n=1 Tax=Strigomonas culicis TaxID=28005 RepID=S9VTA8_9TRYP|nr:protein kinase [Strigomonas culicis]EPY22337.1 protein kinase [Strigomonas culicis]EPY29676.1 protein kinase [Strigomonas culicis]EPY30376.1 protein kinase [Strigomonas culicis]EPY32690.1 protein kinase [Strigomonas culicis]|eukprot:EPY19901.1 protein kinase [Strigomonas culicis]
MGRVGEYEVLETLGEGAFSTVKRVRHTPSGALFVAKIIKKNTTTVQNDVRLEISILRRLRHKNIVQLIEILESKNNYYIILEPVMGGDLCDLITRLARPLPEQDVAALFIQLIAGVRVCHKNGVAHRDLKPENLLLSTNGVLKISDFGLSRLHHESNYEAQTSEYAHTLTGTLAYLAPEVFGGSYDAFRADIWSMGCILYVLLTHNFPFGSAVESNQLINRIRAGEVTAMPPTVSANAKDLCLRLLSPAPERRPSLDEVANHAFFAANLPPDYLAKMDGRRTPIINGANTNEFSSVINEDITNLPSSRTARSVMHMGSDRDVRDSGESNASRRTRPVIQ